MSAKRKAGTPKTRLHAEVDPANWQWLYERSKARDEAMGLTLDKILYALRQAAANLAQDRDSSKSLRDNETV